MRPWWLMLAGCEPDEDEVPEAELSCEVQDNALRADCTAQEGDILSLSYEGHGEHVALDGVNMPSVTLWGLVPDTEYTVTATLSSGEHTATFRSGSVPDELAQLQVQLTGTSAELEGVLQSVMCEQSSYLVGLDLQGRLRWYQQTGEGGPAGPGGAFGAGVTGYSPTPDGVVALVGLGVQEWDWLGQPGLTLGEQDLPLPVHHDVARAGERTLVLFHEAVTGPDGESYLLDGINAFEPDGTLAAEWHLADHIDPDVLSPDVPGMGGGMGPEVDWSHANSVTETDDGDWLISLRWLDAVMRIDGQIGTPDFGHVEWTLVGDERSPLVSSFSLEGEGGLVPGFTGQHHATQQGDRLWLFDNRLPPEPSRAVEIVLEGDVARTVASHSVGESCDVQGGAVPLPAGGVLATCATSGRASEFPAGSGDEPVFTVQAACAPAGGAGVGLMGGASRVYPLDLP